MKISRRKLLLGGLATIALLQAGDWLLSFAVDGPLKTRTAKTTRLQQQIEKQETQLARARKAGKQFEVWKKQSLPSDIEVARSLYRSWLLETVSASRLSNPFVDSGSAINRKGLYVSLSFSIRCRGSLQELTRFLFKFYQADHLHQIQSLGITPLGKTGRFDVSISIEALALQDSLNKDRLNPGISTRLASTSLSDYRSIVHRNVFGVGNGFDEADHAYLTAVTFSGGHAEAWITLRSEDRVLKLKIGQSFNIGPFSGTVVSVEDSDVVFEADGERWLLSLGENLSEAFALPPEF